MNEFNTTRKFVNCTSLIYCIFQRKKVPIIAKYKNKSSDLSCMFSPCKNITGFFWWLISVCKLAWEKHCKAA